MRELMVSEAPHARVSQIAKDAVEDGGGVVSLHTRQVTHFDHLRTAEDNWSRSGYVGTYQPFKSKHVRIRVRVWASWPRRLFRGFVFLGLAEAVLFFALSLVEAPPSPNVWILTAVLTIAAIALSLLTYATSWSGSAEVEESLARDIGSRLRADEEVVGGIYTMGGWQEHREDVLEAAVEGVARAKTTTGSGGMLSVLRRRGREEDEEPTTGEDEPRRSFAFLGRRKTGEDERAEQADAVSDEEDGAQRGLLSRFKRSKGDHADEDDAPDDSADDKPHEKRGLLGRFKRSKDDEGEADEASESDADESTSDDEDDEKRSLLSRFKRGKGDEDDDR